MWIQRECPIVWLYRITSSCLTICWRRLMVYFIHHWQQYNANILSCWWDKLFSNSIYTFTLCINQFLKWNTFSFLAFKLLYISTRFLCLWTCSSLLQPWVFCYLSLCCFHFGVPAFVLFQMLWMLVAVNKVKFSPRKIVIAF